MEENRNDIEILKAMIKENFEEQRKLIAKLETALEPVSTASKCWTAGICA